MGIYLKSAFCTVYPGPWNSERYVLAVFGISDAKLFRFGWSAPFRLPDYVTASKSGLVYDEAGYFDENREIMK